MWRAWLLLCACGGTAHQPAAIDNRSVAPATTCELPARFDFEARRYANLDADQPGYQTWSPWRVGIQVVERARLRTKLAMIGDELVWNFDATGTFDRSRCRLELHTDTHEPITVTIDLRTNTGRIRSIDDDWLLGPPFPAKRQP